MLDVRNVSFSYGAKPTIKKLSFTLKEGEILGFLGPNGCGKTTTFRLICNLLEPSEGEILYYNQKIDYEITNEISYLIEERALFPKFKVREMLHYLGIIKGVKKEQVNERINYWLNYFDMTEYENKKVEELSKGNQQKIQFISCLLNEPKLLVLDEPFSGLDVINQREILEAIKELKEKGVMIIFSSHQINEVEKFCDKVCLVSNGNMILSGDIKHIKEDYKIKDIEISCGDFEKYITNIIELKGVIKVTKENDGIYTVKVEDKEAANRVRNFAKTLPNLMLYKESDAKLEEIFVSKVKEFENE